MKKYILTSFVFVLLGFNAISASADGATPPTLLPTMTLTPDNKPVFVIRGNPVTVNLTLTSQNGMTGNPNLSLYCVGSCPAGFSYSYIVGSSKTLSPNGSIPISITFTPSSSATLGLSSFQYWAVLGGVIKKATIDVTVTAGIPTTGNIQIITNPDADTTHQATNCSINNTGGFSVTYGPATLTEQAPGVKTVACTFTPGIYMFDSITPSLTQTLSAGQTTMFTVNLKLAPVPPMPVLSSIQVNNEPTVNRAINVSLFGTNFFGGSQGYVCTTLLTSSCVPTDATFFTNTQVRFSNVRSSFPTTLYLRVSNRSGEFSNYMSMVVIN